MDPTRTGIVASGHLPLLPVSLADLRSRFAETSFAHALRSALSDINSSAALRFKNTIGSTPALALAEAQKALARVGRPRILVVMPDEDGAAYIRSDLEQVLGSDDAVLLFPPTGGKPYDLEQIQDTQPLIQRADVLRHLQEGFEGLVVTSVAALVELVPPPEAVQSETLTVRTGDSVEPEALVERLAGQGFEMVEFVAAPGEMALRGGILDVYPFAGEYPVRIEFFGDELDSIREFDPQTQRSVSRLGQTRLVPNLDGVGYAGAEYSPLTAYFADDAPIALFDADRLAEIAAEGFEAAAVAHANTEGHSETPLPSPAERFLSAEALSAALAGRPRLLFGTFSPEGTATLPLDAQPQPAFNSDMALLREHLAERRRQGFETLLLCDSASQRARLRDLLAPNEDDEPDARLLVESLHEGFVLPEIKLAVYTDHQVFNRYHRPTARRRRRTTGGLTLRDLQGLTVGDFVVHVDYGIGRFAGLYKIEVRGRQQEAVKLEFLGSDELFVNVNALHKLHKYSGKEGHQPKLTKLGSGTWERTKSRTKKRVKDIARDLIQLYAKRKAAAGHAFPSDTLWQREMEASFQYEDTPDQGAAAEAVKQDMEQPTPMDRLVCGDVGFGKTEIAVRAAFKAVQDGKQVAILVPTTLLAMQHYETFSDRLARYPVKIAQLSRFATAEEQKATMDGLKAGEVDIVIGTQRVTSKKMDFKNLGLLIIDEEQRFGVAAKERLRALRASVDTLTLTATPIPRTLQFSLLGVRDLSIISTPPPNRQPVQTEIHTFDQDLIRDAILYETNRGGQVFFVHNRVETIEEMATLLRSLVPNVRMRVAHGQMKASELEAVMHDFMAGGFEVLVSTNIVESGIDVGNANTILINHAERFGLSDLHQLRGRVGRSDQKAFCYLLVPSVHVLTREARMRLQAIEEFSDLGSGFNIAMRDLDIRGAGALLGAEQSGFIADLGYETYHKILEEAVQELRHEEFSDLFAHEPTPSDEANIDVDEDAFIPAPYVSNATERMNLYRRLADLRKEDDIARFRQELVDRFGPLPREVETLLEAVAMKPLAEALRLPKVTFKNQRLFLIFPDPGDEVFYDRIMQPLLARLGGLDRRYVLKEGGKSKLRAIVQQVRSLSEAREVLERLQLDQPVSASAASA